MKRNLLLLLCSALTANLFAGPVSKTDAQSVASSFLKSKGLELKAEKNMFRAPRNQSSPIESNYYYVFNAEDNQGFVIVSGDDRTEQILGYVEEGTFDEQNIPDNMRSWLQLYADQIKYLDDNNINYDGAAARAEARARRASQTRHSVPALMTTKWNQGDPYNLSCPKYVKPDGTLDLPASGCVATALAQVMYYYKYPNRTTGNIPAHSNTYTYTVNGETKTVRKNYPQITRGKKLDWDNMLDTYNGGETDAQRKAVADLMFYIGQSVSMGWGASSGAVFGSNVANAFNKYFGYDDAARVVGRGEYTIDGWFDLLYNELSTGHPVGYSGASSGGAHAFVVDGFDGEELFHLNWGWGGMCDGWFLIQILNPDDNSGIGASSSSDGYSMGQNALIGVNLPDGVKEEAREGLSINDLVIKGESVIFANYVNWIGRDASFQIGVVVYDEETGEVSLIDNTQQSLSLSVNTYTSKEIDMKGKLKEGTYKISPASRVSGRKIWRPKYDFTRNYIEAVVDAAGKTTLRVVEPVQDISVEKIEFVGNRAAGTQQEIQVTFRNNGDEYNNEVMLYAGLQGENGEPGNKVYTESRSAVVVRKNESTMVSFFFKPEQAGIYDLWLHRGYTGLPEYDIYHTTMEVLNPSDVVRANLRAGTIRILNGSGKEFYGNEMYGTMSVTNQANTDFSGAITIQIWEQGENNSGTYWSGASKQYPVTVQSKQSVSVPFSFEGIKAGRHYYVVAHYVGQDGDLDNGGLWVSEHQFLASPGVIYWRENGMAGGAKSSLSLKIHAQACGLMMSGTTTRIVRGNGNPNTICVIADGTTVPSSIDIVNLVKGNVADTVCFTSGYAYHAPVTFTAEKAAFRHTFDETVDGTSWTSFTLPFNASLIVAGDDTCALNDEAGHFWIYEFAEVDDEGMPVFAPATELRANTPYLLAGDITMRGKTIELKGEHVVINQTGSTKAVISSNAFNMYGLNYAQSFENIYVMSEDGKSYVLSEGETAVTPMTSYIKAVMKEGVAPAVIPLPTIPVSTGIGTIVRDDKSAGDTPVYTLTGQKVGTVSSSGVMSDRSKLPSGIYIMNGKKVYIK